jgi:hypothetical protein
VNKRLASSATHEGWDVTIRPAFSSAQRKKNYNLLWKFFLSCIRGVGKPKGNQVALPDQREESSTMKWAEAFFDVGGWSSGCWNWMGSPLRPNLRFATETQCFTFKKVSILSIIQIGRASC